MSTVFDADGALTTRWNYKSLIIPGTFYNKNLGQCYQLHTPTFNSDVIDDSLLNTMFKVIILICIVFENVHFIQG